MYLITPGLSHRHDCRSRAVVHWVHFTAMLDGGMDLFDQTMGIVRAEPSFPREVPRSMRRLRAAVRERHPSATLERAAALLLLLRPFIETITPRTRRRKQDAIVRFRPVLDVVEHNLGDCPTVPELAGLIHLEPSYFTRLFTSHFGMPPSRYILRRRLAAAQRLLRQSDVSIDSIAGELGFCDAFHLSKAFRRVVGVPPSEYRRLGMPREERL
jgi:transcriptional regulator GlxA family with amidase domain